MKINEVKKKHEVSFCMNLFCSFDDANLALTPVYLEKKFGKLLKPFAADDLDLVYLLSKGNFS